MANDLHLRRQPVSAFRIPSNSHSITPEEWAIREPNIIWYGMPVEGEYRHPQGGTYRRCRIEAFNQEGEVLGYLPLPIRYAQAWTQLCYSVVYWMTTWKAWVAERERDFRVKSQPTNMAQVFVNNSSTRFMKYLVARLLIIDELLRHPMSKTEDDQLDVFDEFLIRDRWDLLWRDMDELDEDERAYLTLDPIHPDNRRVFGESHRFNRPCSTGD